MTEHRVIVDYGAENDRVLGYALEHFDRSLDALERRLKDHIDESLVLHTQRMASDDGLSRPVFTKAADHATEHWWGKVSRKGMGLVVGAAVVALLIWLGSLGIVFKGAPK